MLHAVALEHGDRAVVAVDRTRDRDRPFFGNSSRVRASSMGIDR